MSIISIHSLLQVIIIGMKIQTCGKPLGGSYKEHSLDEQSYKVLIFICTEDVGSDDKHVSMI